MSGSEETIAMGSVSRSVPRLVGQPVGRLVS